MGPGAGVDRCGKSRPHRDSIPGLSSPEPVAIPTELPGPNSFQILAIKYLFSFPCNLFSLSILPYFC